MVYLFLLVDGRIRTRSNNYKSGFCRSGFGTLLETTGTRTRVRSGFFYPAF
jgi:hypothetical protein